MIERVAPTDTTVLISARAEPARNWWPKQCMPTACARPSLRAHQLRGPAGTAAGVRDVRPREGRLHRRHRNKEGLFEAADGGTIFLDEIGSMPIEPPGQAAARAPGAEIRKVGGTKTIVRGCPGAGGHQRPPGNVIKEGQIPRRPLLPAQRDSHRDQAPARTARRHPSPRLPRHARCRRAKTGRSPRSNPRRS